MHLVKWEDVCKSKTDGGLGIRKIKHMNDAFMIKWLWKLNVGGESTWRTLVTRGEGAHRNWWLNNWRPWRFSPIWRRIIKLLPILDQNVVIQPGKGNKTLFWTDKWASATTLADKFLGLYRVIRIQNCLISDIIPSG